jgi:predicted metal-dependent hydrolase
LTGPKDLAPEERLAFEKGVDEFNRGFYFECHDTLEDIWTGLRGESRDFLQGLIQVSVGFYHLSNGNLVGAESLLERALKRFATYPERCYGFDLGAHRLELREWLERVRAGGGEAGLPYPRWVFLPE